VGGTANLGNMSFMAQFQHSTIDPHPKQRLVAELQPPPFP